MRFHDLRHTHATLMLKQGVHPKMVSEGLRHASTAITADTYSHILPGLQEVAAKRFDELLKPELAQIEDVGKMLAKDPEPDSEPHMTRTCNPHLHAPDKENPICDGLPPSAPVCTAPGRFPVNPIWIVWKSLPDFLKNA